MLSDKKSSENLNDISQLLTVTSNKKKNFLKKISLSQLPTRNIRENRESRDNRFNADNIPKLDYKPKRLIKISCYNGKMPLSFIGKASLEYEKTFGLIENKSNIQDTTSNDIISTEGNLYPYISKMSDYEFRSNYLYKYVLNLENFNKYKKYTELINDTNKPIFSKIFEQTSELLEKQSKVAFNNKTNILENSVKFSESEKKLIIAFSDYSLLSNKLLNVLFNEMSEIKNDNKKLKRKTYEDDINLKNKTQEIDDLQKYLKRYDVSSKIFLKKTKEENINKVIKKYNHKENAYILLIYELENEIRNLTKILDKNKEYFNKFKVTEKEAENNKKEIEKNKSLFNQKIQEKNTECALERDIQDDLKKKLDELNNIIEEFKLEKENKRKEDMETHILLKKLKMNIMEREENILMLNEELEWYILELIKEKRAHIITKNDLDVLEKKIMDDAKKMEEKIRSNKKPETNNNDDINLSGSSFGQKNEDESRRDSVYLKDVNVSPVPTNFTRDINN